MAGILPWILLALPAGGVGQGHKRTDFPRVPKVTAPRGVDLVADEHLPKSFDWRDVNGQNFVVADVNQHIPQYCGACWVHGTVAALNDRLKVARSAAYPDVMLARQTLLNCVPGFNGTAPPGCMGGEPVLIYDYMRKNAVPDETCNVWKAKQDDKCEPITICKNCDPPPNFLKIISTPGIDVKKVEKELDFTAGCKAIENFIGYHVGDYGFIEGPTATTELEMMKEIYANGPITCGMDAGEEFMLRYTENVEKNGGVFGGVEMHDVDHDIEVTGWGETASGQKYWIARNSWGTYWGEGGWLKIARGVNQNSIESDCAWAKVYSKDLGPVLEGVVMGDYHRGIHRVGALSTSASAQVSQQQPLFVAVVALVSSCVTMLVSKLARRVRPKAGVEPLLG